MIHYASLPFGAVTLTDLFATEGSTEEAAKQIEEFFTEQLKKLDWLAEVDAETQMIGVGGSFRNLYKMVKLVKKYPMDNAHNYHFEKEDFSSIYNMLKALDVDKRKKIKGLSASRADIMPAAMAIINAFTEYMQKGEFLLSSNGLREGIMFNQALPMTLEKPVTDVLPAMFV